MNKINTYTYTYTLQKNSVLITAYEENESVIFIYKETSYNEEKVYKIVFSCKKGKWHKSERIYGFIVPAQEETFTFLE